MTARLLAVLATLMVMLSLECAVALADGWYSEQPLTIGSDVPVSLGAVHDIEFWAPNRGVLITDRGLWAYDGTGWHQLSTVCGGARGRIAWAGPLDFWTISDQPVGRPVPFGESGAARSLCHFVNGAVVASYAQPLGQADSYLPMNGAACLAPDDCWFGGGRLPGTVNTGAFHLHWDGTTLAPWPSLTVRDPSISDPDRTVTDIVAHQGALYEAVSVDGNLVANEPDDQPFLLHEIQAGSPPVFRPLFPSEPIDYHGATVAALGTVIGVPRLSSDGSAMWLIGSTRGAAGPLILRLGSGGLTQLTLDDAAGALASEGQVTSIAAEPGTDSAWVGYIDPFDSNGSRVPARLARVHANGTVDDVLTLPSAVDGIARKQQTGPMACPAAGQCWMATQAGWLFHLGGSLPRDDEPAMHRLITYRPADAATTIVSPDTLPDDNSGIAPPVFDQPPPIGYTPPTTGDAKPKPKKLVTGVHRRLIGRTTLQVSFTLTAKARVQLVAKRKKTVVAKTSRRTLAKGKHKLRVKLNRKRWPTALDLRAESYEKAKT
jgi:hypothetical protein